ncbi:MAG TPA: zinc-ribbon domain-containing protein [Ktedonobacteraceae bacterium]|nr:zinc-ribbon domain-containing protein [Ktedonobacteraceae bacterium]
MDARFYNSEEIDFEKLATDLENVFRMQGYEAQHIGNKDQMMVQLKKGSDLVALIGLQTALSVTLQHTTGGVVAMIGQQKWVDKAAVGAVGLIAFPVLWPLMITAGAGAVKQAALANQVLGTIDSLVMQQIPGVHPGPLPVNLMPQFQQYWSAPPPQYTQPQYTPPTPVYTPSTPVYTPPAPAKPRCPTCNTTYEPGDTFCSGCGRALTPPRKLCPNCNAEVKPGVSFCSSCGTSTFQATSPQAAKPAARPPAPVYTPPSAPTVAARPATPVYTPPTAPAPQPYVPPAPKDPEVVPQPSVTLIPGKPKPATPATPPPAPPVPVYIPPRPVQPPTVVAQPQTPAPPAPTIKARPASEPAVDLNAPWGTLIFNNGKEFTLTGERVLVGRYDHDLGGVQPEVDLGSMEGADTVSRGHATIEHVGSTYQLTDLGSTNFSRLNGKRLDANVPTSISDGDTLQFGKITCTFKKL